MVMCDAIHTYNKVHNLVSNRISSYSIVHQFIFNRRVNNKNDTRMREKVKHINTSLSNTIGGVL